LGRVAAQAETSADFSKSQLRRFGIALVCAKVALIPVLFDPGSDVPFSVVKALASHALAYVLAGTLIGLVLQFGPSILPRSWLHIPVVAFLLTNVAATIFAADQMLALYGDHSRMTGLGTIADGVLLYFAIVLLFRTRGDAIAIAASFFLGSAVVLAYELIQAVGRDPFTWGFDSAIRPFSTIGQTNNLAEYLTVVSVAASAVAVYADALRPLMRVLSAVYAVFALMGVVFTQTRSAILGLVGGIAVFLALAWAGRSDRRVLAMSLLGAGGTTVALAGVLLLSPLGARFFSTVEISDVEISADADSGAVRLEGAADVRLALYRISFEMWRDRPILGYGPDNFMPPFPRYRSDHEPIEVQESGNTSAHSWIAQTAVTSGLVGLLIFVAGAATAFVLTVRSGFRPGAWIALVMLGVYLAAGLTTVNAVATDWLFWAATGAIAADTSRWRSLPAGDGTSSGAPSSKTRRGRSEPASRRTRPLVALACVALGFLLALTTASAFEASRHARSSQVARLHGRSSEAIDFGLRATRADPRRPQYWDILGLALVSGDRFRDAVPALEEAHRLAPYDIRYDGDLARTLAVLAQRGDAASRARAREVAERAARTDPNNPLAQYTRAVVMQIIGDLPEALKSSERALALDRTKSRDMYVTGAQVLTALGRAADAIILARRGMTLVVDPVAQVPIRVELTRALAASGQLSDALTEVDAALALQPKHAAGVELRAQIVAALGQQR
jgi:O-antigen ligase/cytochrome c-type biogenesis protein CcmH/NrfG